MGTAGRRDHERTIPATPATAMALKSTTRSQLDPIAASAAPMSATTTMTASRNWAERDGRGRVRRTGAGWDRERIGDLLVPMCGPRAGRRQGPRSRRIGAAAGEGAVTFGPGAGR